MNTEKQIKIIVLNLVQEGVDILKYSDSVNATDSNSMSDLTRKYINWFTKSRRLIKNLSPEDLKHFENLYKVEDAKNSTTIAHFFSFPKDQHWNASLRNSYYTRNESHYRHFKNNFTSQIAIIEALPQALAFEKIKLSQLLARDLLTDEITQAKTLFDKGFIECAGMIAGIALERQLKIIADNSYPKIIYSEKDTLGSLNIKLKNIYSDPSDFSRVDALRVTRNRCSHDSGTTPPAKKDVEIMILDVNSFIKNH